MFHVSPDIQIPFREFHFTYARSGGPGGQNVNKVNTKVTLRWNLEASPSIDDGLRERFKDRYARRLTTAGELVLHSQRFRDQGRNVADVLEKLRGLILDVATPPTPRKPTRRTRGSVRRRLRDKRQHSQKKQRRNRPTTDD